MTESTAEAKARVRAEVRASRRARPREARDAIRDRLADRLAGLVAELGARRVTCFLPVAGEPDTSGFLERARADGVEVLLPISLADAHLDWALDSADGAAATGRHGIAEPTGPRLSPDAIGTADLLLIPACAVDERGIRLGWGMGYYDRALPRRAPGAPVFAVVHEDELLADLPAEPHDVPVDGVVTPERVRRF